MNVQVAETLRLAGSMAASIDFTWGSLGWIVGLLLIAALSVKEMVRAAGGSPSNRWVRTLNLAIVPLLVLFAVAVVDRVVPLLPGR